MAEIGEDIFARAPRGNAHNTRGVRRFLPRDAYNT